MKPEIIWSKDAGDELAEIVSYIKYNNGKINAEKIYQKIMNEVKRVSENAAGRRIAPMLRGFGINYIHQLNVNPWILFYKANKGKMEIISIIDGRRNLEEILYRKVMNGTFNG